MRAVKSKKTSAAARLVKLLAVLSVAGAVAATPWAARAGYRHVAGLSFFRVTEVRVSGLKHVRQEDFISYIGDPRGKSVLTLDAPGMIAKMSAHPWIKEASFKRELPGAVRVEVLERNPAAVADTGSGRYLVDEDGVTLASITGGGWDFLPVVQYPAARVGLTCGRQVRELKEALELLSCLRKDPTERLVGAQLSVDEDGSPCMRLEGAVVKVGQGGYEDKVRRLSEVSLDIQKKGVSPSLIDLRFPGKVVVKS